MKNELQEIEQVQFWNAFANGVVPKQVSKSWLIGRDRELAGLESMLEQVEKLNISGFKLIEGSYGSGKSMLLSVFEQEAISRDFVVARFSLNPQNNFSKPELIYRDIMNHLKINQEGLSEFETIFENWLKEMKSDANPSKASKKIFTVVKELHNYHPSFANVLLIYIRAKINNDIELAHLAASFIKGDYNIPYEQKKKLNIKGSIDRNNAFDILKGFSKLIELLGFKGLVVLVDELEYIKGERSDIRNKAYITMRHLIDEIGENTWVNTIFVGAHTPELIEDEIKGFKSYEALYQRISSGFNDKGKVNDYKSLTVIPLLPLKDEALIGIGENIAKLKKTNVDPNHMAKLALLEFRKNEAKSKDTSSVRKYLKMIIHLLELAQSNPNMPIFNINR